MKKAFLQHSMIGVITTLLVIPTFYFLISAFLHFELGIYGPWSVIEPVFEQPENKSIGVNINLLILFGPAVSLGICLFRLIKLETKTDGDQLRIITFITTKSYLWFPVIIALLCLGSMFLYSIAENCNCH
jgi:hypothetical protein